MQCRGSRATSHETARLRSVSAGSRVAAPAERDGVASGTSWPTNVAAGVPLEVHQADHDPRNAHPANPE